ncbi:hypothetical protein [Halegenticoccus tardaugens]|uniref:hypothetical protein n=1 Tax=Halegenticoccus tardaugens TaxID=2071624 RepID=UPI00100AE7AB|nr:hypothetical protein [Halegenticoccus tardaugens]
MTENMQAQESISIDTTRRRVLRTVGGLGATVGFAGLAGAQDGTPQNQDGQRPARYVLGGRTETWVGLSPVVGAFYGQSNPPLRFQPGDQYEVVWINLDGNNHEFQLLDEAGEDLEETESTANIGETRSVRFQATQEMARYRCEYHPQTMLGEVQFDSEYTTAPPTPTPSGNESNR